MLNRKNIYQNAYKTSYQLPCCSLALVHTKFHTHFLKILQNMHAKSKVIWILHASSTRAVPYLFVRLLTSLPVTETCHRACWYYCRKQTILSRTIENPHLPDSPQFRGPTICVGFQRGRGIVTMDRWHNVTLRLSLQLLKTQCYHVKLALAQSWWWVRIHSEMEKGRFIKFKLIITKYSG